MSYFIDRDPEKMLRFSKDAKTEIGDMVLLVRKVEGVLESCKKDLDGPTQEKIEKLHTNCAELLKHVDVYTKVADEIETKGKKLASVRNGGN